MSFSTFVAADIADIVVIQDDDDDNDGKTTYSSPPTPHGNLKE